MKRYLAELVGTFFLVLAITVAGSMGPGAMGAMAIGSMFMAMIYLLGPISGSQLNPAVTLALWFRGAMSLFDALMYMLFQVLGSCLFVGLIYVTQGQLIPTEPLTLKVLPTVAIFEFLLTFVLCAVIVMRLTSHKFQGDSLNGITWHQLFN